MTSRMTHTYGRVDAKRGVRFFPSERSTRANVAHVKTCGARCIYLEGDVGLNLLNANGALLANIHLCLHSLRLKMSQTNLLANLHRVWGRVVVRNIDNVTA